MIDFHSHVLFEEDPGIVDIHETVRIIKSAQKAGFSKIIVTPEIKKMITNNNYESNLKKLMTINNLLRKENINVQLYLGNEIHYGLSIPDLLEKSIATTINNSRYILLKMPENNISFHNLLDYIFQLQINGYRPILSNIECYSNIKSNPNIAIELIRREVLLQLDILSVKGKYGNKVKLTAKKLLKEDMIHFLGTNAYRQDHYDKVKSGLYKIKKIVGKEKFKKITQDNCEYILQDRLFYPDIPNVSRKKLSIMER